MDKKGQVTVFIILSILIIAGVSLYFAMSSPIAGQDSFDSPEANNLEKKVNSCLKETSLDAIYYTGAQGGYNEVPSGSSERFYSNLVTSVGPEGSTQLSSVIIPYYVKDERNLFPENSRFSKEISSYVEQNIGNCLVNLSSSLEYDFSSEGPNVDTTIGENVKVSLDYPVVLQRENASSTRLESFESEIGMNLERIYQRVEEFVHLHHENPSSIPQSRSSQLAYQGEYKIESIDYEGGPVVQYNLVFDNIKRERNYMHSFMIEYDWEDI